MLIIYDSKMPNEANLKALELLRYASTPNGFVASVNDEDNYKRVWTRDSAMCGLASLSCGDEGLIKTFKASIETILQHQHRAGFIPSNVSADERTISYGNVVGRVDNHAWIVISACQYAHYTNDIGWLQQYKEHFEKCFRLMEAWEFNSKGLMYVPQSADWADEYHHHGYILFNQLLRLWALQSASVLFKNTAWIEEKERVLEAIDKYFCRQNSYYSAQTERHLKDTKLPYWWMGFNTSTAYLQFDLQANALGLLLGLGTAEQQQSVVKYVKNLYSQCKFLLPSFYLTITQDDKDYVQLKGNYAFRFRNLPHEFHNGGLWSVWNGLMAFAIAKYDAQLSIDLSQSIKEACKQNNWEFNECQHGETHQPIGVPMCAWSAAGLLLSINTSFRDKLLT